MSDRDAALRRIELESETDLAGWRNAARGLLAENVPPEAVEWRIAGRDPELDLTGAAPPDAAPPPGRAESPLKISRTFLARLKTALLHSDPERFALAYRLLWRLRDQPDLPDNPADPDIDRLAAMEKAVRRDIHKMHAFVRFRSLGEEAGRERYAAWFEPEHHIEQAVAPFFRNRFAGMDWLIVTPKASIAWDGKTLQAGPGGGKDDVPAGDAVDAEWRAYYASIFNPARVKTAAMKSEMPVKYWKNLPEAELIPGLIQSAPARVEAMIAQGAADPAQQAGSMPAPNIAEPETLDALYRALAAQNDYPATGFSEKLVLGEGPADARIMFVGEQPGDVEDREGRPFVGPAGEVLTKAMEAAGIDRGESFVTNAVKRFKFEPRGPRRIHRTPTQEDIDYYRWWLDREIRLVAPKAVVGLGGSAAKALTGQPVTISRARGAGRPFRHGSALVITVHPSYLLRLPDRQAKKIEYDKFVRDLKIARDIAA